MLRSLYSSQIQNFINELDDSIIGKLSHSFSFSLEPTQRDAWVEEIKILKSVLREFEGELYFEFSIPRMGKNIDVLLVISSVIFILEFKVGESSRTQSALDQVMDYALDLMNFHETSHNAFIAPILIPTEACDFEVECVLSHHNDNVLFPISSSVQQLANTINDVLAISRTKRTELKNWDSGKYCPTPSIVAAAQTLYNGHSVEDISRSDASAVNLNKTTKLLSSVIEKSKKESSKSICFVTGVPGSGKTLVGLNIATLHSNLDDKAHSVYLSGNGPLVKVLCEALAHDAYVKEKMGGGSYTKSYLRNSVKAFIQNVHHFRDEYLRDTEAPSDHVVLFDEAQRAWNREHTANFMRRKKGKNGFAFSEPEFLISCMDRHKDWAVIVCLVGGGQEINMGEAGISEWLKALLRLFPDWKVYISPNLRESEYGAQAEMDSLNNNGRLHFMEHLHLSVSMRSFRAEKVSNLIKNILDIDLQDAQKTYENLSKKYPIVITRNIDNAKKWIKAQARGTERFGLVVSSQAQRLKPHAIDIRTSVNPIHWFLKDKNDVRSSYYLEEAATEFDIQGLELDWACVVWDGDLRYSNQKWEYMSFKGSKWQKIKKFERQVYLKNAYRVLLTRARQGMVIVVPEGSKDDPTRDSAYYDPTYEYLKEIGIPMI